MNDRHGYRVWDNERGGFRTKISTHPTIFECDNSKGENFHKCESQNFTLEQCTGLKDKNGNLVFEGDILKVKLRPGKYKKGVVCWKIDCWRWEGYSLSGILNEAEIVGNVHENEKCL